MLQTRKVLRLMVSAIILTIVFFTEATTMAADPVSIIFDTDIGNDCDDAGALAVLHALADNGEVDILGVICSSGANPYGPGAVDAINTYYGRPNLIIGAEQGDFGDSSDKYTRQVGQNTDRFGHNIIDKADVPSALTVYRQLLAAAPDNSVTIVTIGHLKGLSDLLSSSADSVSSLDGMALVKKKVKEWVCMGGYYSEGTEFNLAKMDSAPYSKYVIDNWPIKVVFSSAEVGNAYYTGKKLENLPTNNPVRECYYQWANYYDKSWPFSRQSWDQTAVLYAVRGLSTYWNANTTGYNSINEDGRNKWLSSPDKDHHSLINKSDSGVGSIIENLMIQAPTLTPTPTPADGPIIQAEDALVGGGVEIQSNATGYNGSGFLNFPSNGGFMELSSVEGGTGGSQTITIRYALGSSSRTGALIINGVTSSITFEDTGSWDNWDTMDISVSLNAGSDNVIRLESTGSDLANIDEIIIPTSSTPTPTPADGPIIQAEDALVGGGVEIQSNATGYNGSGFLNFPSNGGFMELSSVEGGTGGSQVITIRYALGASSRTGALIINGVTSSITFEDTGSWDNWDTMDISVSLNAGSDNIIRLESTGSDLANIDEIIIPTSSTPTPADGPIIQAEDALLGGGVTIQSNATGYNGSGFVNFPSNGGFMELSSVEGGTGGSQTITIRYALGASSRTGALIINGVTSSITFEDTGAWDNWDTMDISVSLNAGSDNVIRLESTGSDLANIDEVIIPTVSSEVVEIQAEDAFIGGGVTIDADNTGFYGSGFLNFPTSGGWLEINDIDGGSGGSVNISIRYALLSGSRTGNLVVNGSNYSIDFSASGGWDIWTSKVVTVNLNPGTDNTIRLESTGSDLANIDEILIGTTATVTPPPTDAMIIQAEDTFVGGGVEIQSNATGYNGSGFVNFPTSGGWIEINDIDGGSGDSFDISIRYALLSGSRTGNMVVNGNNYSIDFSATGGWDIWTSKVVTVNLNSGTGNTIRFESTGSDLANIDEISIASGSTAPVTPPTTPPSTRETKYVFLLVLDGVRYTESWGLAGRPLIPELSTTLLNQGVAHSNFWNKGETRTIPGHTSLVTGRYQNLDNDGTELPRYPTLTQAFLKATGLAKEKAWVITSKHKLEVLNNSTFSGWEDRYMCSADCGTDGLGMSGGGSYREDSVTMSVVQQVMNDHEPHLVVINLKDPDSLGHANDWSGYLQAIVNSDNYAGQLWTWIQASSFYKDKTALIVTHDHGRHSDGVSSGFVDHGCSCEGCQKILCVSLGPDFKKNKEITTWRDQLDLASTMAYLLDIDLPESDGEVMMELFE